MLSLVQTNPFQPLSQQRINVILTPQIDALIAGATAKAEELSKIRITVISSTSHGGGVSEMLHSVVPLLNNLAIKCRWLLFSPPAATSESFFQLTKGLHNAIHNSSSCSSPDFSSSQTLFQSVGDEAAEHFFSHFMEPLEGVTEIIIIHDPQPISMARRLRLLLPAAKLVWRCHIGSDRVTPVSQAAWDFLFPYIVDYDTAVFSSPVYLPPRFPLKRVSYISPCIDPSSAKNRELSFYDTCSILHRSGLVDEVPLSLPSCGLVEMPFTHSATLYFGKNVWRGRNSYPTSTSAPHNPHMSVPFFSRPVISQVSRWDRLKGFEGLLHGFHQLKSTGEEVGLKKGEDASAEATICNCHLLLVGPDPLKVRDDPEGAECLRELCRAYDALPSYTQAMISIVCLPMDDPTENALIVNAIQRSSFLMVQNSYEEGWGLTALESMYKRCPVVASSTAVGLRSQIQDGHTGILITNPSDPRSVASALRFALTHREIKSTVAYNGQCRAVKSGLIYSQVGAWLSLLLHWPSPLG